MCFEATTRKRNHHEALLSCEYNLTTLHLTYPSDNFGSLALVATAPQSDPDAAAAAGPQVWKYMLNIIKIIYSFFLGDALLLF